MYKTLAKFALLFAIGAQAQVQLGGHISIPSSSDSIGGLTYVKFTANGACNIITQTNCTITNSSGGAPDSSTIYTDTIVISDPSSLLTGTVSITIPLSPGKTVVVKNNTNQAITIASSSIIIFKGNALKMWSDGTSYYSTEYPLSGMYAYFDSNTSNMVLSTVQETTGGSSYNTGLGYNVFASLANASGGNDANVAIGYGVLQSETTGARNTGVGSEALFGDLNGSENVALGFNSLLSLTTSNYNVAIGAPSSVSITTGTENTAVGMDSLGFVTTGSYNTAIGGASLEGNGLANSNNTSVGYYSGRNVTTQPVSLNNDDFFGVAASPMGNSTASSNEMVLGNTTTGAGSNTTTIGNSSKVLTIINGQLEAPWYTTNAGYLYLSSGGLITTSAMNITQSANLAGTTRLLGGTYHNISPSAIYVQGSITTSGSATSQVVCSDGTVSTSLEQIWGATYGATVSGGFAGFSCVIPPSYYYSVTDTTGVTSLTQWFETTM